MGRPLKDNIMYYAHDADAFRSWKFSALRARYGDQGWAMEGRFWALNCMIADAEGCRLDLRKMQKRVEIAKELGLSLHDFDAFLSFLSDPEACDLIRREEGFISTDRTQEELARLRKARNQDRTRKSENPPSGKPSFPAGFQPEKPVIQPDKGVFRGASVAERSVAEGSGLEASGEERENALPPVDESRQPAAASFLSLLKTSLAAAGIELADGDFDAVASQLIAASADCQEFVTHAIGRCKGKENKRAYLITGILKYGWAEDWRRKRTDPGEKPKGAPMKECPECHTFFQSGAKDCPRCAELAKGGPTLEEQKKLKAFTLETALAKRRHPDPERPLSEQEKAALAEYDAEREEEPAFPEAPA